MPKIGVSIGPGLIAFTRIFVRLAHYREKQVGDALVHGGFLLSGRALLAREGAFTGHKDIHNRHTVLQEKGEALVARLLCSSAPCDKTTVDVKDLAGGEGCVLEVEHRSNNIFDLT